MINKDTALIVIDIQAGVKFIAKHFYKELSQNELLKIIKNNQQLVDSFQQKGLPVFIVTVAPPFFSKSLKKNFTKSLLSFSKEAFQITKESPSAFKKTNLESLLNANNIHSLVITGISTDNGVLKTEKAARRLGFQTAIISDATGAKNKNTHLKALSNFEYVQKVNEYLD
ncbi:isochorismatase family cysteine hydrolase (plasmid) [Enterococcus sp. 22-H-5-01]|uniref:isochorismatase family cysteine hydrolase n=1 Tax=Enterococcus sp. 22-H-5-01 TaxID=3418555 RepID=UPI003D058BDD